MILPVNSLKENEIYAPNFRNGEQVALIRHPHGGTFEIPVLRVNNNHPGAKKALGTNPRDAVGINSKVAERLSGADFDGDTVLVIPNGSKKIKSSPALDGLKNFDPIKSYPSYEGMPKMSPATKQTEMGKISNLITDMTIRGANPNEIARAVRHSMVVIDAEKHNLNYKLSAEVNGIKQLTQKYQSAYNETGRPGASTLISKASARTDVPMRRPRRAAEGGPIDRETGERVYVETGESYVDAQGRTVVRTQRSQKLAETRDARTLSSGTVMEEIYADHSNKLKALANEARREAVNTKPTPYSPSARKTYAKQVQSLDAALKLARSNAPLERQAQVVANTIVAAKKQANPNMDADTLKKIKFQALNEARLRTGAKKQEIEINWDEWNAIQAGAVSNNKVKQILDHADLDKVKALATPRNNLVMTSAKQQRAQAMLSSGYTQSEVADALGVALSTLKNHL